ncbi:SIMPL domain-containing protein [Aestuariibacter sp. AA17]|uniref:SIMPL domain-containing protein n=1 Tax=Fluctibacter corallii TaxID=2984329 RepID=A0ABT3AB65_9ALTE|nr:SIMPL domain-containing protein [Aestuariibacter sp. AA17]MCV2885919.1 SIMPL domain-containing protein [Aestuariibacter sp. AA17]
MKYAAFLCFLIGLLTASSGLQADTLDNKYIRVSGAGSVASPPTGIQLTLGFEEKGNTAEKLYTQLGLAHNQVIDYLKDLGIEPNDMQSTQIQFRPVYRYENNRQVHEGFMVSQSLQITMQDLSEFPRVIDGVIRRGVARIENFSYQNTHTERDYMRALALAVDNAKARATRLAKEANVTLGEVIRIEESSSYTPMPEMRMMKAQADMPQLMQGAVESGANVTVTFAIK